MAAVRYPGGGRISAPTWPELEDAIRADQFYTYNSKEEFRNDMKRRAELWSGEEIDVTGSAQDFIWELSRARLLEVEVEPGDYGHRPFVRQMHYEPASERQES